MSENTTAAHGQHTTHGVPHGYTSLTPFIVVADPAAALAFYENVFGASTSATEMGGAIVHAEVALANGRLQLGVPQGDLVPTDPTAPTYSLAYYCDDVDALVARAEKAGATVREPLMTFVSGDRYASILDPQGVRWTLMTRVEDLSQEESERRVNEWAAQQG